MIFSQEPGALPFIPNIRSQFQHVFIIVRAHNPCSDNTQYRYGANIFSREQIFFQNLTRDIFNFWFIYILIYSENIKFLPASL